MQFNSIFPCGVYKKQIPKSLKLYSNQRLL
uniref:Uncharacterized protein n=1 Tax=Rhizophora mucronata TaxID=61149 RepID=A0A2P2NKP7_RHIMU